MRAATIAVFVIATMLRLVLAIVNRESSDNHVDVIDVLAFEREFPQYDRDRDVVKEAFQPKLYHATVAAIVRADPFDLESRPCAYDYPAPVHVILIGQTVSALAGILTLWVVLRFLALVGLSAKTRFFTFALVALSPALIAINVQVTNDSFMILFGSLASYWGYRFFRDFRGWDFAGMTAAAIATAMSKATGLPMCLAITLVFAITLVRTPAAGTPRPTTMLLYALAFWIALLSSFTIVAPNVGTYRELYRRYGSPFVTNRTPEPFPRLFARTQFGGDPGVRSIAESLFTFRIIDLLREPRVGNGPGEHYPLHRTSLWSQVYARWNSIRFDDYFESWRTRSALAPALMRLTFVLALFPAALFVFGAAGALVRLVSDPDRLRPEQWLVAVTAAGYTAFLIVLALRYRDFSFFKPIHALAGLLAFLVPFGYACDRFYSPSDGAGVRRIGDVLLAALIVLYAFDCGWLAAQLLEGCRNA